MSKYKVKNYINLASPILGTKIYSYSDQFFGAASRMLKENSPIFKEDVYDKHGKWMDGWETRRKRIKGNDFCIIKLCLLYTSPSPRDTERSRMPSSA